MSTPLMNLKLLAPALRDGSLSLLAYLEQLESHFQRREPEVLAFVPEEGRFDRLRREAEDLLEQYPAAEERPPLFGVPVGIKDIFHVAGFPTRAGSRLPEAELQGPEASIVTVLKGQGTLILGKTITTEFAYFAPGPTRNPHDPRHTPGGSSSGSAAAVGAGLAPLTLGTQTIGSVSRPAAFCGVVGYKPSYDRLSRAGVIPLAPSLDHVGLFTTDVASAKLAAELLVHEWQEPGQVGQPVLGIPEGPYLKRASTAGLSHFALVCDRLAAAGYEVKRVAAFADFEAVVERHQRLMAAETAAVHAKWFARHELLYHPRTAVLIREGRPVTETQVAAARAGQEQLRRTLMALMEQHQLDLWLSPAAPGPAPAGLSSTGDPVMNLPWTHSGLPTVVIPAGFAGNGLPLGLQLAGRWVEDERLLQQVLGIEQSLAATALSQQPLA